MRAITTLLFGLVLHALWPGITHGQCQITTSTNYSVSFSAVPNSTGADILTSVVVDGSADMEMNYPCPDSVITQFNNNKQNISHYPSVTNQVGSVGGLTNGPSFCAICYGSYQTNVDSGPVSPGQTFTFSIGGTINCSVAGLIFNINWSKYISSFYEHTASGPFASCPGPLCHAPQSQWCVGGLHTLNITNVNAPDFRTPPSIYPANFYDNYAEGIRTSVNDPWSMSPGLALRSANIYQLPCTVNP
jgi:hypothetical protein